VRSVVVKSLEVERACVVSKFGSSLTPTSAMASARLGAKLADHRMLATPSQNVELRPLNTARVRDRLIHIILAMTVDSSDRGIIPACTAKRYPKHAQSNNAAARRDAPKHLTMPLSKTRRCEPSELSYTLLNIMLLLLLHRRTLETGALMSLRSLTPSIICFCGVP
jgi:hypothetical protein